MNRSNCSPGRTRPAPSGYNRLTGARPAARGRAATFFPAGGSRGMKIFLGIGLLLLLALAALKLGPVLLVPVVLVALVLLVSGALLLGGFAVAATSLLFVAGGLLAVVLAVLAVLSPVWLPVLAVLGLVSLCRRRRPATA